MRFFHLSSRLDGTKRLQNLLRGLERAGHTLTACRAIFRLGCNCVCNAGIDAAYSPGDSAFKRVSEQCASADAVLFFHPAGPSVACGIGMAWASGVPVFAIGNGATGEPYFLRHCIARNFETPKDFIDFLASPEGAPDAWAALYDRGGEMLNGRQG